MQDVTQSSFISARIFVKLAIIGANLDLFRHDIASLLLCLGYVIFERTTAADVGYFGLRHALSFLWNENFQSREIPIFLYLLLCLLLLGLYTTLDSLNVALQPPFLFQFAQFFLSYRLFAGRFDLLLLLCGSFANDLVVVFIFLVIIRFTLIWVWVICHIHR